MFELIVEDKVFSAMAEKVGATGDHMELARTSSLRKFRKRFETMIKKEAAHKLRIPQKAIANRFFSSKVEPGDEELTLWIGTWSVSPFSLGSVSAYGVPGKSGGVRVGRKTYPGAFLASVYTPQQKIWIRLHSRHYSPERYPTKYKPGDRGLAGHKGRFPVVRAAVPIDGVMQDVIDREEGSLLFEFEKIFVQELNYYVNVKGNA